MLDSFELGSDKMEIMILTKKNGFVVNYYMDQTEINTIVDVVKSEKKD